MYEFYYMPELNPFDTFSTYGAMKFLKNLDIKNWTVQTWSHMDELDVMCTNPNPANLTICIEKVNN